VQERVDAGHARLSERIDASSSELNKKIDGPRDSLASTKVWALLLYIALAAVNLGTLARGLGWM
jgi:hypothetical protein